MPVKRNNTPTGAARKTVNKKKTDPALKFILNRLDTFEQRFDALDQKVDSLRQGIQNEITRSSDSLRQEIQSETTRSSDSLRQGIQNEITRSSDSLRQEIQNDLTRSSDSLRQEIQNDLTRSSDSLRQEIQNDMTRSSDSLRQEFKNDMAQSFAAFYLELKAEMQKEFEKHGAGIHQHFSRVENELKAENVELRENQRKLLTAFDASARDYEEYRRDRVLSDGMLYKLRDDVEELKKRDMEKAAAIDKIEKQIEISKAA